MCITTFIVKMGAVPQRSFLVQISILRILDLLLKLGVDPTYYSQHDLQNIN